jgi:phosphate acyltransferase
VIAVDLMGGDKGAEVTIPGVRLALKEHLDLKLILVCSASAANLVKKQIDSSLLARVQFSYAATVIEMAEKPTLALRRKKDSSMHVAVQLVKDGVASGCVSSGNTGALMAVARFYLGMIQGISRPAIMGLMPTLNQRKDLFMLDLGANVESTADHLVQFAVMGNAVAKILGGLEQPQVYLLNIGHEAIKGTASIKNADKLLSQHDGIAYQGYLEPDALFSSPANVLVCDGFVGNAVLKSIEGTYYFFRKRLVQCLMSSVWMRLLSPVVYCVLRCFAKQLNPEKFNGAVILGLNGVVVKGHGSSGPYGFAQAILRASRLAEAQLLDKIRTEIVQDSG